MKDSVTTVVGRAILPGSSELQHVVIEVEAVTGRIERISPFTEMSEVSLDALRISSDCVLLPGLTDCHVHLNQPGRTEWEGFETGSLAAVSGGVTTLIDMPLNSIPPTTTVENFTTKREEALRIGTYSDLGFWGGIIPGNAADLVPMLEAGVKGFKCFLINSGVDEFPHVTETDLELACQALAGTSALILFHAELDAPVHVHNTDQYPDQYTTFLNSRPASLELTALDLILRFAVKYPTLRFHIVHLSAAAALPIIRAARQDGVRNLTVETCFHYLCLAAEEISPNQTQYKCCPPIRHEANRQLLLQAVQDRTIDYIVSDHSPCVPELKQGDFMSAWGGVSGLGLGLSLLWTEMGKTLGLKRISELLGSTQAQQVSIDRQKGAIQVGLDADFIVFDPTAEFEVTEESLRFRNKISPYIGKTLTGRVRQTYIRGKLVWDLEAQSSHKTGNLL